MIAAPSQGFHIFHAQTENLCLKREQKEIKKKIINEEGSMKDEHSEGLFMSFFIDI